jgi:hypothetical protein
MSITGDSGPDIRKHCSLRQFQRAAAAFGHCFALSLGAATLEDGDLGGLSARSI